MDTWDRVDAEREALCEDLAGLDAGQWDAQSLCTKWKVRHVVGHLVAGSDVKAGPVFLGLMKSGMNFNRYIAAEALDAGAASSDSLLAGLRAAVGKRKTPPMAKPVIMLIDTVCHSGDIRRPLGLTRKLPEDTLIEVADNVKNIGFPLGARKRIAGLRLVASDLSWSAGEGPVVEGPAASLILAMAGRANALEDLSGEGVETLASRM
jgi:uncharacterized protein (TIGR03083 family)